MNLAEVRKKLHQLAETANQEKNTAGYVVRKLREAGIEDIREGIGGFGILATADSGHEGPEILFRAELDALPIDETIEVSYASATQGVSHKCGHDGHMAILLGLAGDLGQRPLQKGKVHMLFQPAEETGEGAVRMLESRKMPEINPDHVFALHNLPGFDLNTVVLRDDVFAAGSRGFIIRLTGSTSHAAHPENAASPASAVASLISDLQNLPRTVIPFDRAALITVIHVRMGEKAFGTTPGYAGVMATLRAHEPDDLDKLAEHAAKIARTEAKKWNLKAECEWTECFQPAKNDPASVEIVEKAARSLMENGKTDTVAGVLRVPKPFSWSEDFGRFTEKFRGSLFGLGAGVDQPQMHHPGYDFPDELLETGCSIFSRIVDILELRSES